MRALIRKTVFTPVLLAVLLLGPGQAFAQAVGIIGADTPTNYVPVANPQQISAAMNAPISIILTGADANGDALRFSIVGNPSHGSLSGFNGATGVVIYTPSVGFLGSDSFTFKVNDGIIDSEPATVSVSVNDVTPPTGGVVINGGAAFTNNRTVTLTLTCTDNVGCTQMQVATDGSADTEPFEAFATSKTVTLPVGDGAKTVAVRFRDAAGNISAQVTDTIILDTVAPTRPTFTATSPASPANNNSPRILGTAEADSTVRFYTNSTCTSAVAATGSAAAFASPGLPVNVPDNTTTTFFATSTDAAGNTSACSTSSITYVEDSAPPALPVFTVTNPVSPANNNSPRVLGTAEAGSTVRLYSNATCTSAVAGTGTAAAFASPGLPVNVADNTTTTFFATATDAAGNTSACSTSSITYVEDSAPPSVAITSAVDGNGDAVVNGGSTTSTSITFTFEGSDNFGVVTFECSLDAAAFAACTSPATFTDLAYDSHNFRVRAQDAAGNVSTAAAFSWTASPTFTLTVNKAGTGSGTVTSTDGTIDCGMTCIATYPRGTIVPFAGAPDGGSFLAGWSDCSGTSTCGVTMNADVTVTATFDLTLVFFTPPTNFEVGAGPTSVAVGDFNLDWIPDLVVANVGSNNVSVLLGDGTGSFGPATNFGVGTGPHSVAISDFNLDGIQDLAVENSGANNVSVLLGDGTGSFGPATNLAVGLTPLSVAIGDFNLDGMADLAVANFGSDNISILLSDGTGSFGLATNFPVGSSPFSVAIGDLNLDGILDLAVANGRNDNVSILLGDGTGSFGLATNFPVGSSPVSVAVGDFNLDGIADLAVANLGAGAVGSVGADAVPNVDDTVFVLLGDGTGGFFAGANFAVGTDPRFVAIGDFNLDGIADLAVANSGSNTVSIILGP